MERYAGLAREVIHRLHREAGEAFQSKNKMGAPAPADKEMRALRKQALTAFWRYGHHKGRMAYLMHEGYSTDWKRNPIKLTGKIASSDTVEPNWRGKVIEVLGTAYGLDPHEVIRVVIGGTRVAGIHRTEAGEFVVEPYLMGLRDSHKEHQTPARAANELFRITQELIRH